MAWIVPDRPRLHKAVDGCHPEQANKLWRSLKSCGIMVKFTAQQYIIRAQPVGYCVFLYSSIEKRGVQELHRLATRDVEFPHVPWIDEPVVDLQGAAALSSARPVDGQIEKIISEAEAVVFVIGPTGPGRYQKDHEIDLVRKVLEERQASGTPLPFVPVLLKRGELRDLPAWAAAYTVVNYDRATTNELAIYTKIKQRLRASPEPFQQRLPAAPNPPGVALVKRVVSELSNPPCLTVFIGPYTDQARPAGESGPMAMTSRLLTEIGLAAAELDPLPPWPSEAAEWVSMVKSRSDVEQVFQRGLAQASQSLGLIETEIAALCRQWYDVAKRDKIDWTGLVILTTRMDLALEYALVGDRVDFTRIIPTFREGALRHEHRRAIEQWEWKQQSDWYPDPPRWQPEGPWTRFSEELKIIDDKSGQIDLLNTSMRPAKTVVLVKLCGSLDVKSSLMLTISDFFEAIGKLYYLPQELRDVIRSSPQLLIGCGFASPLAQLVRLRVLGGNNHPNSRILVMPADADESSGLRVAGDYLNNLERRLLKQDEDILKRTLGLTELHREDQARFISQLTQALGR